MSRYTTRERITSTTYFGVNYAGIDNFNNYTGYTYDEVLDLYFAQARFYDPQTKGFTQEDPIKDGLNWYSYVANNPVNFIDSWGLAGYIFYDADDYKGTAEGYQKVLMDYYDLKKEDVILISVSEMDDLVNGWNAMGANGVSIDAVIMIIHANPEMLGVGGKGNNESLLYYDQFDALDSKNVGSLILMSCNAGHLDYSDHNIASQFAKKINGGSVIACDGEPQTSASKWLSSWTKIGTKKSDSFKFWRDGSNSNSTRGHQGWIIYQQGEDGKVTVSESQGKSLSIKQMLKILSKR